MVNLMSRDALLQSVSDEEFKAEAKRRGYNLIKIQPYVKLLPCVCGRKRIGSWMTQGRMKYYRCDDCGLGAAPARSDRQAKIFWNEMIEEKMKDESGTV